MSTGNEALVKLGSWGRALGFRIPSSIVMKYSLMPNDILSVKLTESGFKAELVREDSIVFDEKALIRSICESCK